MKFGIFVCILVVLAYHEALGTSYFRFPARIEGDCQPWDLPDDIISGCNKVTCTRPATGGISFTVSTCPRSRCQNGKELGSGPHDLEEFFPACCRPNRCD